MCLANGSITGDGFVRVIDVADDVATSATTPGSEGLTSADARGALLDASTFCHTGECGGLGLVRGAGVVMPRG